MSGVGRVVSRVRGGALVALVGVVALTTTAVAPPVATAGVAPTVVTGSDSVVRWDGVDRYVVSANISRANFPGGADSVFIANGLASADALAAGPVAGGVSSPILLVKKGEIPASVKAELERLNPADIVILGGEGSVSAEVATSLAAYARNVYRVGGADRYEVSVEVAGMVDLSGNPVVYVANGLASADALAAGPVVKGPILLVKKDAIPPSVAALLGSIDPAKIVILGGEGSVSPLVASQLGDYAPTVERWAGADRYAVSANISELNFAPGVGSVFVANGLASADALAAGPVAAMAEGPILLVKKDSIPATVAAELERLNPSRIVVLGGTGSVSTTVEDQLTGLVEPESLSIVAWGFNELGQATAPAGLTGVTAVAAGGNHSLALQEDGTVVAWGDNEYGQATVPAGLSGVTAVAAGLTHSLALQDDGTVVTWGDNGSSQGSVPSDVSGVTAIAAGGTHSLALQDDGTVVAWGDNGFGQATVPVGLTGVIAISAGWGHSLALKSDGSVVAWGADDPSYDIQYGQANVPAGLTGVVGIAAGGLHSLALRDDGTLVGWGSDGDEGNVTGQATVPAGLAGVIAIAAGGAHSVALKSDGTVVAWGANDSEQAAIPSGLSGVTAISAGGWHSLALTNQ